MERPAATLPTVSDAAALADRLGRERLTRPAGGSALIGLGEREVLKVMALMGAALSKTEAVGLAALDGRLPVAMPPSPTLGSARRSARRVRRAVTGGVPGSPAAGGPPATGGR